MFLHYLDCKGENNPNQTGLNQNHKEERDFVGSCLLNVCNRLFSKKLDVGLKLQHVPKKRLGSISPLSNSIFKLHFQIPHCGHTATASSKLHIPSCLRVKKGFLSLKSSKTYCTYPVRSVNYMPILDPLTVAERLLANQLGPTIVHILSYEWR